MPKTERRVCRDRRANHANAARVDKRVTFRIAPEFVCPSIEKADRERLRLGVAIEARLMHLVILNKPGFGVRYAAREANRGQLAFATRSRRSSTPANPIKTLDAQAGQVIALLPTTLQS